MSSRDTQVLDGFRTSVSRFVETRSPVARVRGLRDGRDPTGFSWDLWREMASLGWLGAHYPEALGGAGLGFRETCVLMEAAGRTLMPEPLISTVLLGGQALVLSGLTSLASTWVPRIVAGDAILTAAFDEPEGRYDGRCVQTAARRDGQAFVLSGQKVQVLDAHVAQAFVVSARTSADDGAARGITLFLVPASSPGVAITRQSRIDGRNVGMVSLRDVRLGPEALVGRLDGGWDILSSVLDRAAIGIAAEMLGSATQAFEDTLEHLRTRRQFDVAIASFQALRHRAARMYIELVLARSAVAAAARAVDEAPGQVARLASLAKARCSEVFMLVTQEGVQMHGGLGVTDECDIGLYLKRARVAEFTFGDASWHRRRWAELQGY